MLDSHKKFSSLSNNDKEKWKNMVENLANSYKTYLQHLSGSTNPNFDDFSLRWIEFKDLIKSWENIDHNSSVHY